MKSLVNDALSRVAQEDTVQEEETAGLAEEGYSEEDAELIKAMSSQKVSIKIIGCGGGGTNTIDRLVESGITGADMFAANTDAQHLLIIRSPHKILLGRRTTRGLGAGAMPQVGEEAAREAEDDLRKSIQGANIVFITAGLGGGTGTGSAPFVAQIAKEMGALTIAICTSPFKSEGAVRAENAEWGLERLRNVADTVIVIPNDKLLELVPKLSINAAFKVADEVLVRSIRGITDVITKPGLVNLDFNDFKTIMKGGGVAMIGLGEGEGEERATDAITEAVNSPLIDVDISSANAALVNVIGGQDMTLMECEKVISTISTKISPNARVIWGTAIDPAMEKRMRVMVVLTGVKSKHILGPSDTPSNKTVDMDFIK